MRARRFCFSRTDDRILSSVIFLRQTTDDDGPRRPEADFPIGGRMPSCPTKLRRSRAVPPHADKFSDQRWHPISLCWYIVFSSPHPLSHNATDACRVRESSERGENRAPQKAFLRYRLSSDGSTSCASCHDPKHAFADRKPISSGAHGRHGNRHAPSLIGRGYGSSQFWDGRAATLEEQVLQPILSATEITERHTYTTVRCRRSKK